MYKSQFVLVGWQYVVSEFLQSVALIGMKMDGKGVGMVKWMTR